MSSDVARLPTDLRRALSNELRPDERVLFAGQSDWRAEIGGAIGIGLFGLGWSAVTLALLFVSLGFLFGVTPPESKGPDAWTPTAFALPLFMLPFCGIGLVLLAAPFSHIYVANRSVHVVTDQRLMTVTLGRWPKVESTALMSVIHLTRKDRRNGSSNVLIGHGYEKDSDGDTRMLTMSWSGLADGRTAENAIVSVAKNIGNRNSSDLPNWRH